MTEKLISDTIEYLLRKYPNSKPCSIDEINLLEEHFGIKLPNMYRQFLLSFGNGSTEYMVGTDYTLYWLRNMKIEANKMLLENNLTELSTDAFVFWMHQGYQFMYFETADNNQNPAIFYYNECYEMDIIKVCNNMNELLYNYPESLETVLKIELEKYKTRC
jgi:SMI1-KNR4 cell-wall